MRASLKLSVILGLVVLVAAVVSVRILVPSPPKRVRIAAGAQEGMYMEAARRYREILGRAGVTLDIIATSGSIENISRLRASRDGADLGFVQGGTARGDTTGLHSLASVFLEPLWVFVGDDLTVTRLAELRHRRIAIGAPGSGTRVLALELLESNGIRDPSRLLEVGGGEAVQALLQGRVDAAFFVTAKPFPLLEPLVRASRVRLVDFARADAYPRRYPYLMKVVVPAGLLDLAADLPAQDVILLAPVAALVARDDLHPAIIDLLMDATSVVHGGPQMFAASGQFPTGQYVDVPLSPDAQRWFRSGPTFLRRHLPFWVATLVERLLILVPLVGVGVPLLNLVPRLWQARFARKIHRAYALVRALEAEGRARLGHDDRQRILDRLGTIEHEMCRLSLPANQIPHLYHLRLHIEFIRRELREGGRTP